MKLITIKTNRTIAGFPSKTDPLELQDDPIHPLHRIYETRVQLSVNDLRNGVARRDLIEVHGHIVVEQAEAYLRGEPVLRIRQFAGEKNDNRG